MAYGERVLGLGHLRLVAIAGLAVLLPTAGAWAAAPGDLDTSFGGGRVVTSFGEDSGAGGVAVQPDGKVVIAGYGGASGFGLARFLADGSLDPSFDGDGKVTTPIGAFAVAVQPDGKIVAAGEAPGAVNNDFAFVRYQPNGELDGGFGGGDGVVVVPVGVLGDSARAVTIGPAGEIAATGTSTVQFSGIGAGVALLDADGDPVDGFAGDGTTVVTTPSGNDDRGGGIAVQGDGKVLVASATGAGVGDGFTIVRLTANGAYDSGFGGDGIVETPIPGVGGALGGRSTDLLLQPDGKVVAGGYGYDLLGSPPTADVNFAIARYATDGELDPSFAGDGIETVQLAPDDDLATAVGRAADGKLVLAGSYDPNPDPMIERSAPALARFDADGSLDPAFGAGGKVVRPLLSGLQSDTVNDVALRPDGRIVTAGYDSPSGPVPGGGLAVVTQYVANPGSPPVKSPDLVPGTAPNRRPDTNIKLVRRSVAAHKLRRFTGTASDPDGGRLRRVQIALVRLVGRARAAKRPKARCLMLRGAKVRFKSRAAPKRGGCSRRWLTVRGKAKWSYELRRKLPKGRYVVYSRAVDAKGLAENRFSRPDRNRYAFRVR